MKRQRMLCIVSFIIVAIWGGVYIGWRGNNHVVIRTVEVFISNLPESFEGFSILQISDLHGKYFGEKQNELLNTIDGVAHDIILFTGDMNLDNCSDVKSSAAVLDLVTGLHGEEMYWVDGNCGPYTTGRGIHRTGELTDMGRILTDKGVTILQEPVCINRGTEHIFLTPKLSRTDLVDGYVNIEQRISDEDLLRKAYAFRDQLLAWYDYLQDDEETVIAVDHYPEQRHLASLIWKNKGHINYDLMICGHTHGGQIRIPFFGAIYIPTISTDRGGYFPDDQDTRGLQYIEGIPQYISAGLGASASIKSLHFRLFCPPELNKIVLRRADNE